MNKGTPLQEWLVEWLDEYEDSDYKYMSSARDQILYTRDTIGSLLWSGANVDEKLECEQGERTPDKECGMIVVSEHFSKSVRLPVYRFERKDLGLEVLLRNNFFDWKLSVKSSIPIEGPFGFLFCTDRSNAVRSGSDLNPIYFEGFLEEWCLGYYSENNKEFSASIQGKERLWATLFHVMLSHGQLKE